ncbi:hypothetical protein ABT024_06745 [Streptomyces sp. NPDC002812]|uniref:hypothetical protein n=1 Tax=Streptomyces sp. NPDC002812 TaxID=3154434 RepID=UPI003316FD0A
MHEMPEPPDPVRTVLTAAQRSRVTGARAELQSAREVDLAELPIAALILHFERLRGRLDDMVQLIDETHG